MVSHAVTRLQPVPSLEPPALSLGHLSIVPTIAFTESSSSNFHSDSSNHATTDPSAEHKAAGAVVRHMISCDMEGRVRISHYPNLFVVHRFLIDTKV